MKKLVIIILWGLTLISCTNKKKNLDLKAESIDSIDSKNTIPQKIKEDNPAIFTENCVIFMMPSKNDIDAMRKEKKKNLDEYLTDLEYYSGLAIDKLDSSSVRNYYTENDIIRFQKKDNNIIKINKKEIEGNMLVFNRLTGVKIMNYMEFKKNDVIQFLQGN